MNDTYIKIECCECHYPIIVTQTTEKRLRDDGTSFYCINGHCQSFKKTTAMKLQEEIKAKNDELSRKNLTISRLENEVKTLRFPPKKRGRPRKNV